MIEDIYDALLDDEALAALPGRLAAAIGARSSTLQFYEGETPIFLGSSYFSSDMTQFYMENGISQLDCWTPPVIAQRLYDQAVYSDLFLSREDFKDTGFYNEFFRTFGDDTGFSLGAVLRTRNGMVGLGLHHALRAASFGEAAADRLNSALPHLKRMAEGRLLLRAADNRERDLQALLHAQARPILLVNALGAIRFANRAAERLLGSGDGLSSKNGHLRTASRNPRLDAAIAGAAGVDSLGDAVLIERPSGSASYRLLVAPHRGPGARPGQAMVLIEDPTVERHELSSSLRALFGLSPAEADLAVRLFAGETLSDASDARGVLVSTARTQLKVILAKTGLNRQSELLAMIGRLPHSSPPHDPV